jgi:hypothetical protein
MQRIARALQPGTESPGTLPVVSRLTATQASAPGTMADDRAHTPGQPGVLQVIAHSPRTAAQSARDAGIRSSARMVAQRRQMQGIFGDMMHRFPEPETTGTTATAQLQKEPPERLPDDWVEDPESWLDPRLGVVVQVTGRDEVGGGRRFVVLEGKPYIYYEQEMLYRTPEQAQAWEQYKREEPPPKSGKLTDVAQDDRHLISALRLHRLRAVELSTTPTPAHAKTATGPSARPPAKPPQPRTQPRVTTLGDLHKRDDGHDPDSSRIASVSGGGSRRTVGGGTSSGSQTVTLQQPAPTGPTGKTPDTEAATPQAQPPRRLVLRLRGSAPQPQLLEMAPNAVLIHAFLDELVHGNMWGGDAAASQLADAFGVQFMIHHRDEDGGNEYTVTVGSGGPLMHLLHQNNHYNVLDYSSGEERLIAIIGDGSCLFRACFRAVMGREPTPEEISAMREIAASGMSEEEITLQIIALREEAREGGLFGVGPRLRQLLRGTEPAPTTSTPPSPDVPTPDPETRREQQTRALRQRGLLPSEPVSRPTPVMDAYVGARDEYRANLQKLWVAKVREDAEKNKPRPSIATPAMDAHIGARDEYRANMQNLLEAEGLKNAEQTRRQREEERRRSIERPRVAAEPEAIEPAPAFTLEGATLAVNANPPASAKEVDALVYGANQFDALAQHGYMASVEHNKLLKQALDGWAMRQGEALARRREQFDPQNSDTWAMNSGGVQYANKTTEGAVTAAKEGAGVLASLGKGQLQDRHDKPVIGKVYHQHLAGGSWGIAFMYVLNEDYTVTAWVIDLAYGRDGNKYKWQTGGTSYVPTRASLPKSHSPKE